MGLEYFAICREQNAYTWLGRFYEWSGIDRREYTDAAEQVPVGYGYMFRLVQFMREHENCRVEVVRDEILWDLSQNKDWKEFDPPPSLEIV